MKKILIVLLLITTLVSCARDKNEECMKEYHKNDNIISDNGCKWLKDENNNYVFTDEGHPIPNN